MADGRPPMVHVIGSINRDHVTRVDHHPRPGETVVGADVERLAGGKGLNQAVAAARAGAAVLFVGAVGDDADGSSLVASLVAEGVDVREVAVVDVPTGTALVTVDRSGENTIVVVAGANGLVSVSPATLTRIGRNDVVVGQLEVPQPALVEGMRRAREAGARSILNAAPAVPLVDGLLRLVDVLVVNEAELDALGGLAQVRASMDPGAALIATRGASGSLVVDAHGEVAIDARPVTVIDSTGAGDCFVGVLAAELVGGRGLVAAAEVASAAASLAVQRSGAAASMPTADQIDAVRPLR